MFKFEQKSAVSALLVLVIMLLCGSQAIDELSRQSMVEARDAAEGGLLTDLAIIEGDSWQKFLSTIPAISRLSSLPPILLFKEENRPYIEDFINYQKSKKILIQVESEILPLSLHNLSQSRETIFLSGDYLKTSTSLAERRWKKSHKAILVSDDDYEGAILSSPLAARYQCPLLFFSGETIPELTLKTLRKLNCQEVIVVGEKRKGLKKELKVLGVKATFIPEKSTLTALYLKTIALSAEVNNLIVTNPLDIDLTFAFPESYYNGITKLSLLSAPLSLIRKAPILFYSGQPEDIEEKIKDFEKKHNLALKYLTLVGDQIALPPKGVPDPVYSNEEEEESVNDMEVEIGSYPGGEEPLSLAVGRIVAEDVYDGSLILARTITYEEKRAELVGNVLMLGNADGALDLCEIITRATVKEFENWRVPIKAYYNQEVHGQLLKRELPGKEVIISEGHLWDFMELFEQEPYPPEKTDYDYAYIQEKLRGYYLEDEQVLLDCPSLPESYLTVQSWDSSPFQDFDDRPLPHGLGNEPLYPEALDDYHLPLSPYLIFGQSCDTLDSSYAYPLFRTGTIAYIGTTSSIHSASGAAFTKAFFDAILYEDMDIGSALLYAKNYLLTWVKLKKGREHYEWGKAHRVALSFTLWGDPTTKLYLKTSSKPKLSGLKVRILDPYLLLIAPPSWHKKLETTAYYTKFPPGGELAGVVKRKQGRQKRRVPALLFATIKVDNFFDLSLETSDLKEEEWTCIWDKRQKRLYLLAYPKRLRKGDIFAFTLKEAR